ncbi:cache domain-containing protein [Kiloniella laminariae]|uniref:histidine kinase n=1 Tax=Kiloniella laminariae TaxID=454162 RepID=A0ABT4LN54_9PROT|nr:cache domain-containing protein [Kiloniella laminariae]MCZ4282551.1 cache domain-containing protein [Kiloniella laminariae]
MIRRLYTLITRSLRHKMLFLVLFPVMIVMPTVIGMAYLWSNEISYRQLLMKVTGDLSVAHEAFLRAQQGYLSRLGLMAESYSFQLALAEELGTEQQIQEVARHLDELREKEGFDFVYLADTRGCDYWDRTRCNMKASPLLQQAKTKGPVTGVEIFSSDDLAAIDPQLPQQIYLPLIPTPRAKPTERLVEDRGMVLHSYYPLRNAQEEVRAYLVAGVLVNRDFAFVDRLRDIVYSKGSLAEDSLGTITVFLEDVRINTNVPRQLEAPGQRALGTRVSEEVRDRVLEQGEQWIDRAFVVSEWYISAYEAILDVRGERVGMLYAGFLEAPFKDIYLEGLKKLLLLFVAVTLLSVVLAMLVARSIFRPIEAMAKVISRIQRGDDLRIGWIKAEDEVAILAQQFDVMLDQLQEQRDQIQSAADGLEQKVAERTTQLRNRTDELERNIALLSRTREQLVAREKLAAIGELTAGIAHEINNPTAVILGNMDLMIDELGEQAGPVKRETDLVIQQVYRIRAIINNLLQYSRPSDYQNQAMPVDINRVVSDTLVLVQHDLERKKIGLELDLRASRPVDGNHQQFQQVLINLIVNAVQATETGGRVILRSRNWRDRGVVLVVRDSGSGIAADVLPRIFDPFYTGRNSGTGLGLSVSYGILQRYKAEIEVRSRPGIGSCFFIWFRPAKGKVIEGLDDVDILMSREG